VQLLKARSVLAPHIGEGAVSESLQIFVSRLALDVD
jgi:hypothetical protein